MATKTSAAPSTGSAKAPARSSSPRGLDYFFHRSGVDSDFDRLLGGEKVQFEVEPSPKGPRAKNVRLAA